jgi:hypothetical protein
MTDQVLVPREVAERSLQLAFRTFGSMDCDLVQQLRAALEAKQPPEGMTALDVEDDNSLRFIQRVLESDAPEQDRSAALDMVREIRVRVRKTNAEAKPQDPVANVVVSYDMSPSEVEGEIRDRLMALGWIPPAQAVSDSPVSPGSKELEQAKQRIAELDTKLRQQVEASASILNKKQERIAELERLSVTNIIVGITHGEDGMGEEIMAKSVKEVEAEMSRLAMALDDAQTKLTAEREARQAAERDAERYRYIRSDESRDDLHFTRRAFSVVACDWARNFDQQSATTMWSQLELRNDALDRAIDAAIAQGKEPT